MPMLAYDQPLLQNLLSPSRGGEFLELNVALDPRLKEGLGRLFCFDSMGDNRFELGKVNAPLFEFFGNAENKTLCAIGEFDFFSDGKDLNALVPVENAENLCEKLKDEGLPRSSAEQLGWFDWETNAFIFSESDPFYKLKILCGLDDDLGNCPRLNLDMDYSPLPGACEETIQSDLQILSNGLGRPMHFEYNDGLYAVDVAPALA